MTSVYIEIGSQVAVRYDSHWHVLHSPMYNTNEGFPLAKQRILNEIVYNYHLATEYERILGKLILDKNEKLEDLKKNQKSKADIVKLEEEIETLRALFENYNAGMNYFRRARGGRSGLRE